MYISPQPCEKRPVTSWLKTLNEYNLCYTQGTPNEVHSTTMQYHLQIELGRYKNIPIISKICLHCKIDAVDEGYHAVIQSPPYSSIRNNVFSSYH